MVLTLKKIQLSENERNIYTTLLYYSVFNHPLTKKELETSHIANSNSTLDDTLKKLVQNNLIENSGIYYFIQGEKNSVEERIKDETQLDKYLKIAMLMTKLMASFPFVRSVSLSGSISKGRIYKSADIDYFIITEKDRLYIARTLLTLFKKVFLLNSYKYFCLNYFIDNQNLEILDKNYYSATELITLLPTYNEKLFCDLINQNQWFKKYYKGELQYNKNYIIKNRTRPFKWFIEKALHNRLGSKLDSYLMQKTDQYRRKKFAHLPKERFDYAFETRKHISRHHPDDFRNNAMTKFLAKVENFERETGVKLLENETSTTRIL